MRRRPCSAILCTFVLLTFASIGAAQSDLARQIDAVLADPRAAKLHSGVHVVDVTDDNKVLYSQRAEELFCPASNMKLLTTAAALDRLGPDFAFVTVFALRGDDLVVLGSGDPGLGDPRLAEGAAEPIDAAFVALAEALKKAGITRIAGDVVVDDTVFDREFYHPGWPPAQFDQWYAAEVGGFNFNDNCVDIRLAPTADGKAVAVECVPQTRGVTIVNKARVDPKVHKVWFTRDRRANRFTAGGQVKARMWQPESVPVHNPPEFAANVLADTLERNGVTVAGQRRVRIERVRRADGTLPPDAREVMRHAQPLAPCIWRCNTHSQNFIAESLFKALGAYAKGSAAPAQGEGPPQGSWDGGRAEVLAFLKDAGLPTPEGLVIDDGSGLSKANRVSPRLLAELLARMPREPTAKLWYNSLATAGKDGTLRNRFKTLEPRVLLLAKTGTLSDATALSGYVLTPQDRLLAFSILFDRAPGQVWVARERTDKIVILLSKFKPQGKPD